MGVGYIIGCLLSILLWKFDRQKVFYALNKFFNKVIRNNILIQITYLLLIIGIAILCLFIKRGEIYNFITALIAIDISNTENKNLKKRERVHFYDSISIISRTIVCGLIAPLLYILFFGNVAGIIFMIIYNISVTNEELEIFNLIFNILTIIPSVISQVFLYLVYICRNKRSEIDFKGDYFYNCFIRPLLNVDILGAYIESINFYYHYNSKNTDYIKSYGGYTKKIDEVCIKDYISISYAIGLIVFVIFYFAKINIS